ncbi:zinc finger CCCH domain-containing protein 13 isoform X3 [Athalia rosae]|uniref:zinc finger CCCH domain-containing protein 13 isoform X3 n=1 Tax=Athalia rosae TaxID=37344 RepID=UPI0020342B9D|nr:zinc finger CCCH domain-containing protein 13 isoform X3 [Athalia rosae]
MSYGYNKYSSSMSSRGRGFSSRGGSSYRGRGGGGEWSGGSTTTMGSRGGGGYSASRGRFNYSTPSYDSRSKYTSGGGSERYSSRGGRGDNSNSYKRSSRDSYSGRDEHRSSSESARKRLRTDSYQGGGSGSSSQRYSSSYGGSSAAPSYDDNKRSSSSSVYDDSNKRPSERPSTYHRSEDRHSASRGYAPPPPTRKSQMPPPSVPRYTTPSRGRISHQTGSYRGRISTRGGRGFQRLSSRSDAVSARKRTLHYLDYRRKLMTSRSRDYIQRVRVASTKIRRSGTTRIAGGKKDSSVSSSVKDKDREMAKVINAAFSDDDEDEDDKNNWDDDEKNPEHDEEEDEEKKKKEEKRKKEKQERDRERPDTEDEDKEDREKEEEDDEKHRQEEPDEAEDEEIDEEDKEAHARGAATDEAVRRADGRRFIKLNCPHCAHRSVTFKEYSLHLYSGRHNAAMRRVAARHKATLARMRVIQRRDQRNVEARDAQRGTLPSRTMFCPICKLNYRSLKAVHQLSESHRQMKRFLTPFCRVCKIQFRSPMLYESHVCTLDHIKRKSALEDRIGNGAVDGAEGEAESSGPDDDDKEVNLDNFMTLDSVGDVDAEENEETAEKKKKEKPDGETPVEGEKKAKNKQMIKVGAEYIKRVEVQFCELCKVHLPRSDNLEQAVALHCSTRSHLKRYVRDNDDKALRRQAERIHLQTSSVNVSLTSNTTTATEGVKTELASPPAPTVTSANTTATTSVTGSEGVKTDHRSSTEGEKAVKAVGKNAAGEEDDEDDYRGDSTDKIWDDVDKDLGDILQEVEPSAKSSDDEDSRYDRFRNSEKKLHNKEKEREREANEKEGEDKDGIKKTDVKVKSEKSEK